MLTKIHQWDAFRAKTSLEHKKASKMAQVGEKRKRRSTELSTYRDQHFRVNYKFRCIGMLRN